MESVRDKNYKELSLLQYLRCTYGNNIPQVLTQSDIERFEEWKYIRNTLNAYFFDILKSNGLIPDDRMVFEVGCGAQNSIINGAVINGAHTNLNISNCEIITPFINSGFEKGLEPRIIECNRRLVRPYELTQDRPISTCNRFGVFYETDDTFMMLNPFLRQNGHANTGGLSGVHNNGIGNIVYGYCGFDYDKDVVCKQENYKFFKNLLDSQENISYVERSYGYDDAYFMYLATQNYQKARTLVRSDTGIRKGR